MNQKSLVPYLFILFILGYMSLDFFFIYLSKASYNGVVTEHAYEKGVQYNKVLNQNKLQQNLGWHGNLKYEFKDGRQLLLKFELKDQNNKGITGAMVTAKIIRPVTDKYDVEVKLEELHPGKYQALYKLPLIGQWDIKLKALSQGEEFFLSQRIMIRDDR